YVFYSHRENHISSSAVEIQSTCRAIDGKITLDPKIRHREGNVTAIGLNPRQRTRVRAPGLNDEIGRTRGQANTKHLGVADDHGSVLKNEIPLAVGVRLVPCLRA